MGKYPDLGSDKKSEPYPLGMIIVDPIKPIVDANGNPIPTEEKTYSLIGRRSHLK